MGKTQVSINRWKDKQKVVCHLCCNKMLDFLKLLIYVGYRRLTNNTVTVSGEQ